MDFNSRLMWYQVYKLFLTKHFEINEVFKKIIFFIKIYEFENIFRDFYFITNKIDFCANPSLSRLNFTFYA